MSVVSLVVGLSGICGRHQPQVRGKVVSVVAVATISHTGARLPPDLLLPNRGCLRLGTAYMPCVPTAASLCAYVAFSVKKLYLCTKIGES